MVFSSPFFLFAFMPMFIATYYVIPQRFRNLWIVLGSIAFYGWWKVAYLALILGIAAVTFVAGFYAQAGRRTALTRCWALRLGVILNLAILGWFKYSYFLGESIDYVSAGIWGTRGLSLSLPDIILPIGISFLTFQSISYIIDVSRGDAPPAKNVTNFLAFSMLFPQLIAGPILRYKDLADQLEFRDHSWDLFNKGAQRFVLGLSSKLIIADSVAPLANRLFALPAPTVSEGWLGAVAYSVQLFFDFAGYSAMAIGLGLMIGFRFVENFNAPYTAKSITEFWQRWHISLSNWLRDYLYISLGGNRTGSLKTYRNLVLTMLLGGLWHGANWTFVLWGIWHGTIMAIERALGVKNKSHLLPSSFAWMLTMVLVMLGWVMFRAGTVEHSMDMYAGMFGLNGFAFTGETLLLMRPTEVIFLVIGLAFVVAPMSPKTISANLYEKQMVRTAISIFLFAVCFVLIQARSNSPFLYFQF